MAKEATPPKSSGGGGINFEDMVCAWFLSYILQDECPFAAKLGTINRIDFQARPDGWFFDDLVLTLSGSCEHRFAFSVKSNTQFGIATAPAEFVQLGWEQYLGEGSKIFDREKDYVGLATSILPTETRKDLDFLVQLSSEGDPALIPGRFQNETWASKSRKKLFTSFQCPKELATKYSISEKNTGELLSHSYFLEFDFEATVSRSKQLAQDRCRNSLRSGDSTEAEAMWNYLLQLSAKKRPLAGYITREHLIQNLKGIFQLKDLPNHHPDWERIASVTAGNLDQIKDFIGNGISLPRQPDIEKLQASTSEHHSTVFLGDTGTGKTATVKSFVRDQLSSGVKCIWVNGSSLENTDFAAFQASFGLSYSLAELTRYIQSEKATLVFDGLDRLFSQDGFLIVQSLIKLVETTGEKQPTWRIIITCQTPEWPRLQEVLSRTGVNTNTLNVIRSSQLEIKDLKPVWDAIPQAAHLKNNVQLRPILANLKVLDLIASHLLAGGTIQTSAWVGESSVANWYWNDLFSTGANRHARERLAMLIAERQADELHLAIPVSSFEVSDLPYLDDLQNSNLCKKDNESRVIFEHDLFGDWARLRVLMANSDGLNGFLSSRLDSPLWHRAVRLFGTYLLEHCNNADDWHDTLVQLEEQSNISASDLLLDSILYSANPLALLEQSHKILFADGGKLLHRLLNRFLVFATAPDPRYTALVETEGLPANNTKTNFQIPFGPIWLSMLPFLRSHGKEIAENVPVLAAKVLDLWLQITPPGFDFRKEAAELGLIIGRKCLEQSQLVGKHDNEDRKLLYKVAILGADELPDDISAFALEACEKRNSDNPTETAIPPDEDSNLAIEPWPDGPKCRVDESMRAAIFEPGALAPMIRSRPEVATEILLAALINSPEESNRDKHWPLGRELDISGGSRWLPPLYIYGPFLGFLNMDFKEGLNAIAKLVDFATTRWGDSIGPNKPTNGTGRSEPFLRQTISLTLNDHELQITGNSTVYGWAAGLGVPPNAVTTSLMALEQYFYNQMDLGKSVEDELSIVLNRTQSAAMLKVLCDIGKKDVNLFKGPLLPLLSIPELYDWEIQSLVHGRNVVMVGAALNGDWFYRRAAEFNNMEHRRQDLRDIAAHAFLHDEEAQSFLTNVREEWESELGKLPKGRSQDFLQQLIIRFDIENYRIQDHPDHGQIIINIESHKQFRENAQERQAFDRQSFLTLLPSKCRQWIDTGTNLDPDILNDLWAQVQEFSSGLPSLDETGRDSKKRAVTGTESTVPPFEVLHKPSIFREMSNHVSSIWKRIKLGLSRSSDLPVKQNDDALVALQSHTMPLDLANGLCGASAVFIRLHGGWLTEHQDVKEWCIRIFGCVTRNPPPSTEFDSADSISPWSWDSFAAEALPLLLAENPDKPELRFQTARLVFAPHYDAISILFARSSEYRSMLGDDFNRLNRLLFELAHVRVRQIFVKQHFDRHSANKGADYLRFSDIVQEWADDCVHSFVNGTLACMSSSWKEMDQSERYVKFDCHRPIWHENYYLDFRLVRSAFAWLPSLDQAADDAERLAWLNFLREGLSFCISRVTDGKGSHTFPYEDEDWFLELLGSSLPNMTSIDCPEQFWQPILDLPKGTSQWSKELLCAFNRFGLSNKSSNTCFQSNWMAIVDYALSSEDQDEGVNWSYHSDTWQALIGVDWFTKDYWNQHHSEFVKQSVPLLIRWVKARQNYGPHVAAFATWLESEAATSIRLDSLRWLEDAVLDSRSKWVFDRKTTRKPIASLLNHIWTNDEKDLRQHANAFNSFRKILRWLAEFQDPQALELTKRIGGL